jgi:hypothetical protein
MTTTAKITMPQSAFVVPYAMPMFAPMAKSARYAMPPSAEMPTTLVDHLR